MGKEKIRALLVDDHATVRKAIRNLLERSGDVEVVGEADDGEQALEAVAKLRPDVVVLDVYMPGSDGFRVLDALSKAPIRPKVVMVSMFDVTDVKKKALAGGASAFVAKNAAYKELVPVIRDVVG